ncbi:uncharacterized protein PRCAT00001953001 [Priceomyces carsonii]|uniref:uncharacterized protein n=1 Tax=Priceomyces carsonii TaxID=28549 RepID=UPI002EDA409B|nr:unnamed protein product [Priceomyces carsonii]
MPPKKQQPSDKNKAKAKAKSAEDKTFGLKNKNKSKKVQQQIHQIKSGADGGLAKKKEEDNQRRAAEKKAAEDAKREAAALFGIQQQKVPFGVDPKSILCEFFKKGLCNKGNKCKFSHDVNVGRKDAKKDLYTDARTEKENDTMDNWDEEKLRKVILSKHGNLKTTTDKVCKYFIDAVENGKYGWFWVCPNGGSECKYRHSLPPGFVLKTKEQKKLEKLAADSAPKITLEDFIELERGKLDKSSFTPITIESFNDWKAKQIEKRANEKKKVDEKLGKRSLTGREIIMEKLADKYYTEDGDTDEGPEWDLSEFRKELPDDSEIKDYGDGSQTEELYRQDKAAADEPVKEKYEISNGISSNSENNSKPTAAVANGTSNGTLTNTL